MTLTDLISPPYLEEQRQLHAGSKAYGERGHKWFTQINTLVWLHGCRSVLDYGCGRGALGTALRDSITLRESILLTRRCSDIREYDPAIPGKDALPEPADLVVCTDVLEHIEPEKIGTVLAHLRTLTTRLAFVSVCLVETEHRLSDGRQAHILLRDRDWWRMQLSQAGFVINQEIPATKPEKHLVVILEPVC